MRTVIRLLLAALLAATAGAAEAGDFHTDGQLVTTRTDGAPFVVSSTDRVPGLNADTLDSVNFEGPHPFAPSPPNVIHVGLTGADFTSVKEAVDSITDASPTNPYLIRIGPGNFDAGSEEIQLSGSIHLRGSGREATTIEAGIGIGGFEATRVRSLRVEGPDSSPQAISVAAAVPVVLRSLAVSHSSVGIRLTGSARIANSTIEVSRLDSGLLRGISGNSPQLRLESVSILVRDLANPFALNTPTGIVVAGLSGSPSEFRATDLSVVVTGGGSTSGGLRMDDFETLQVADSEIELFPSPDAAGDSKGAILRGIDQVHIERSSVFVGGEVTPSKPHIGVLVAEDSDARIVNSRIETTGGASTSVRVESSDTSVHHSEIHSSGATVSVDSTAPPSRVVHSHLAGGPVGGEGTVTCHWVTDESFGNFSTPCP